MDEYMGSQRYSNKCDIEAPPAGNPFNIFHLNQTYTGDDERLNIGPKGLLERNKEEAPIGIPKLLYSVLFIHGTPECNSKIVGLSV
jgi:hypothetical protein